MKHLSFLLILAICGLMACNNDKGAAPAEEVPEGQQTVLAEDQKKIEELQQLTPYTPAEMSLLLPAMLAGDSASSRDAGNSMGTTFARASYEPTDSTSIELSIYDCGGNAGAGIYQAQFLNQMNIRVEGENEYTRVIDFNGGKAIEHADSRTKASSLTYSDNRLLIIMEAKNIDAETLKRVAKKLQLK